MITNQDIHNIFIIDGEEFAFFTARLNRNKCTVAEGIDLRKKNLISITFRRDPKTFKVRRPKNQIEHDFISRKYAEFLEIKKSQAESKPLDDLFKLINKSLNQYRRGIQNGI